MTRPPDPASAPRMVLRVDFAGKAGWVRLVAEGRDGIKAACEFVADSIDTAVDRMQGEQ